MPFFPEDVKATLNKAADGSALRWIFNNPFVSAGLFTVCVFIILVIVSTTIDIKEITRISLITYLLSVSLLFLNNRVLMHQMSNITEGVHEITPVRDPIIGRGSDEKNFSAIHQAVSPKNTDIATQAINNYPEDFLDS